MPSPSSLNRRRFLGATATTLGGLLLPGTTKLSAALSDTAEAAHFYYRLAPEGPSVSLPS